ncbi:MAG: glycosyltransferase family 2 protein [Candidatus Uhrbacteria bacterium]
MKYDVAIITVSTNKLDEACLISVNQILNSADLKTAFVLVDNASTIFDAHTLVKKFVPPAQVILREKNYGFGHSCNRGAREVEADYYFFLNPDTFIKDFKILNNLLAFMKKYPSVGIAAPRIYYPDGRIQETCRRFHKWYTPIVQRTSFLPQTLAERHRQEFMMEDFDHEKKRMVDWVQGSAFMIDGQLFHKLGGFDERFFMYYEDADLCRRCWQDHRPVYYLPEAEVFHSYGKESAIDGGLIEGIAKNSKTRTHIVSWLKYTFKWLGEKI